MNRKIICLFVCTLLIVVVLPAVGMNNDFINEGTTESDYKIILARIDISKGQVALPREAEIVSVISGDYVDIIVPEFMLFDLEKMNLEYSVLIWDLEEYEDSVRGTYHTLAEMENILQNIANTYPSITSLYSIGTTSQGRNIWCLEITDNPGVDEGEPGVFYMGLHHAREWPTIEICLYIANQLTSQYGTDPDITNVVNNRRLWLVPCVNPDGYYYCHDLGNDWRKNRNYFPQYGTYGVDLNRNYAGSNDGNIKGAWGSIGAGSVSHYPSSEVYCGPGQFSELEAQAIRNVFMQNDICATISWHTYGELVMWPWGYTPSYAPDRTQLMQVGQQIAQKITKQSGSGTYTPQQSCTLYPTTGDTTDWAYGYGHYIEGQPIFAYTIEACSSFHPSASYLDQICMENFDGALYLLQEAENIRNTVIPRVVPPHIDDMPINDTGNYIVSWQETNPNAQPNYFQLDEMTELTITTDNAESGSGLWNLEGFTISTARSYSPTHSYKSRSQNSDTSAMTTVTPIPITDSMKLSFWCWYAIELNYDCAFVEISRDGRDYLILDKFTGSSENWLYKEYDLSAYADESIFIRFRYTTDSYTVHEGFYVDDINPVANFGSTITLSDTITTTSYEINNKPLGTYYYKVRGHNPTWGWGDFSTIKKIIVTENQNQPPNAPVISGPTSGKPGTSYTYTFTTTDPDGDAVYYYIEWGDGTNSGWMGPYASGSQGSATHSWSQKGTYTIKIKARDIHDSESPWGTLVVTMPLNIPENQQNQYFIQKFRLYFNQLFQNFIYNLKLRYPATNI